MYNSMALDIHNVLLPSQLSIPEFFFINPSKLCTHQTVTPNPSSRKTSTSKVFVWTTTSCGKFLKRWE